MLLMQNMLSVQNMMRRETVNILDQVANYPELLGMWPTQTLWLVSDWLVSNQVNEFLMTTKRQRLHKTT